MKRCIVSPRILLIACPIEYYKDNYQYASLSTLLTQEQEWVFVLVLTRSHIQILVKKLLSLNPNIILVGSNVSKHAIDLLLQVRQHSRCVS